MVAEVKTVINSILFQGNIKCQKKPLIYSEFNQQLKQANIALTVAELHGFLTGLICGGITDQRWQYLLYQFTNDDHAYPTSLLKKFGTNLSEN